MEYIVELIDNMASKTTDHLRANPLVIAHCIGAMNIITAISIAQESHVNMNCFLVTSCVRKRKFSFFFFQLLNCSGMKWMPKIITV